MLEPVNMFELDEFASLYIELRDGVVGTSAHELDPITGIELARATDKLYTREAGSEWNGFGVADVQVVHTAQAKTYLIVRQNATGRVLDTIKLFDGSINFAKRSERDVLFNAITRTGVVSFVLRSETGAKAQKFFDGLGNVAARLAAVAEAARKAEEKKAEEAEAERVAGEERKIAEAHAKIMAEEERKAKESAIKQVEKLDETFDQKIDEKMHKAVDMLKKSMKRCTSNPLAQHSLYTKKQWSNISETSFQSERDAPGAACTLESSLDIYIHTVSSLRRNPSQW